jgi:cation transport ATPase
LLIFSTADEVKTEWEEELDTEPEASKTVPAPVEESAEELKADADRKAELEWEQAAKDAERAAEAEKKQKEAEKMQKEAEKKQKEAEKKLKEAEKEAIIKDITDEADAVADNADDDEQNELQPHRRKIHKLFFFISVVAMIAALSMATGQIVGLVYKKLGPIQWVLRGYVIALCFLVLFNELEMSKLARENMILHNWVCRGLLYSFIGVIGLEENDTYVYKDDPPLGSGSAKYFMQAVSWIIVGVGAVYFVMGLLCIQRQYEFERVEFKEKSALALLVQRDLREKRRNEIRERRLNEKKARKNKPHPAEDKA